MPVYVRKQCNAGSNVVPEAKLVWFRGMPILWSPATDRDSAGRRSLEFRLPSRAAGLHLPDPENLKKLSDAIPTDCGPTASMTGKSNFKLDETTSTRNHCSHENRTVVRDNHDESKHSSCLNVRSNGSCGGRNLFSQPATTSAHAAFGGQSIIGRRYQQHRVGKVQETR